LLGGLLAAAALAAVVRWRPLLTTRELTIATLGLVFVGLAIGLWVTLLSRRTLWQQARFADRQFRLQERAATAVEIHDGRISTTSILARRQLADTLAEMRSVDTLRLFPLLLNRQDWLVILPVLLLLAVALLLPNPQEAAVQAQRAVEERIAEQAALLEALQEEMTNNETLDPQHRSALEAPLESALQQLEAGGLNREEAVAVLSEAEAELRELNVQFSQESLRESLDNAGQPLAENASASLLGEALQNGQLGEAGAAVAQLADDLPALTPDQQQALAAGLAETAAALQNVDSELAGTFNEAAEALQAGDTAGAQAALREAGGLFQERQQEAAAASQAANAAAQLAEGRSEVAQAGEGAALGTTLEQESGGAGENGDAGQTGAEPGVTPLDGEGQPEAGSPTGGGGSGGNVFVPDPVDLSGIEGTDIELPAECLADPSACGPLLEERPADFGEEGSLVPYEQVFGDYRDAASEALSDEQIPLGLRGLVRDYFSSLEP
jgi:hypothetical protein